MLNVREGRWDAGRAVARSDQLARCTPTVERGQGIGLSGREISGPRVYLLIPYPPGGRGVSPRSHVPKENFTSLRNSQIFEKFCRVFKM